MNFLAVCLHCLDMRDFHSYLRQTPVLDDLRKKSIYVPMGRGQGHHQGDSLFAEMTGKWTARYGDSKLTEKGFQKGSAFQFPKTVLEYMKEAGYELITCIGNEDENGVHRDGLGTACVPGGIARVLKSEPERMAQFTQPHPMDLGEFLDRIKGSKRFYGHVFLRETHRPWAQPEGLGALMGEAPPAKWPADAACARRAALRRPDEFSALRRRGLTMADSRLGKILEATRNIEDLVILVYSNHGEVLDWYRHLLPHQDNGTNMIMGTSHGNYPYEIVYANMQMWLIPGQAPRVMKGIGRGIDIPATLLDLAGIMNEGMDGESTLPQFKDGVFPARERHAESSQAEGGCLGMVREDGAKLISTGPVDPDQKGVAPIAPHNHRLAVFDLNTDPYEYVNLVDTPYGREILQWAMERHASFKSG